MNRFTSFKPYSHKVWTTVGERVFPLPVTLATINQFYGQTLRPDEARAFIAERTEAIEEPAISRNRPFR